MRQGNSILKSGNSHFLNLPAINPYFHSYRGIDILTKYFNLGISRFGFKLPFKVFCKYKTKRSRFPNSAHTSFRIAIDFYNDFDSTFPWRPIFSRT